MTAPAATIVSDSQLITDFDASLGEDYRQARRYALDVPSQALLTLRSALFKLTGILGAQRVTFDSPNLYNRIEALSQARIVGVRHVRAMHRLRADGNRGAHPEKYHLSQADLLALAEKSLLNFCQLVAQLQGGAEAVPFNFAPLETQTNRELCYRAVMQDDAEAQYLLGMAFKAQGMMARDEQACRDHDDAASEDETDPEHLLAKAKYWFSAAAGGLLRGRYELAVAWLHGYGGETNETLGLELLQGCADEGLSDACALQGFCALTGQFGHPQDLPLAERLLGAAAAKGHTEAEANLGVLYYQQGQLETAYRHIAAAAKTGFASAQYHLYLLLGRGDGCEVDMLAAEHWLAEAASQGQLDAMFLRARHMLHDESTLGSDLKLAEDYLRQVIRYGRSVPAMIELSMALADGVLGRIDVVGAAALLRHAAQNANSSEREIISPLWQSLAEQVDRVLAISHSSDEKKALNRARELLLEMPEPQEPAAAG